MGFMKMTKKNTNLVIFFGEEEEQETLHIDMWCKCEGLG